MPRVHIPSVRALDRFRPLERIAVDWLTPHPDGLHLMLDRALERHFGSPPDTPETSPAAPSLRGESADVALAALRAAGYELWALTAQPEHARVYAPLPNAGGRLPAGGHGRPRARFFVTRRTPVDPRLREASCPWCPGAREPSAS